ncbi:branched-chain amino acid aminotransferase [Adhaeribacter soli]|uniref:branched-chain-amino-acid transaminase n=1 Tax=Adhaeribacter soli TaxID=2607655 RepID=A0A5N1J2G2_9BACT|nr:branched-chain amino acid aminotransferase [Adhaeribacter soli]KAA9340779.1 branched-chain amino acid aminotransferase [Adhaeribacter soli]
MIETASINITRTPASRISELDYNNIEFGKIFADHMFMIDFVDGQWQTPQILPYGNLSLSPATSALHYGQAIFEGMKAYKDANGEVLLFRPVDNARRLNLSAERMCMPTLPEELFMQGLSELIQLDKDWVPPTPGTALYIRPFMFATDAFVGVRPSANYKFMIFCCPVGAYYANPLRVKIETDYTRSVEGGAGFAKAAGNYGASMLPSKLAQQQGYHQLIWTDGKEHKFLEESGTMNLMFVIDGKLITPALSTSILAGITRDSVLQLARDWGMPVEERQIAADEIIVAHANGTLQEAFGCGTAAVIAPIITIGYEGKDYDLPALETREFSNKVAAELDKIKTGEAPDLHNWMVRI